MDLNQDHLLFQNNKNNITETKETIGYNIQQ